MKKADVMTDILKQVPIAHSIPKRLQPLFGTRIRLPETGQPITTLQDNRDKMAELEMVPALQKSLINLIGALQGARSKPKPEDYQDIAATFGKYKRSGLENID